MPDQILIGKFSTGEKTYFTPFNIDNDAFPVLYNAYSWRGRVKKKRGTSLLGQLQRQETLLTSVVSPWQGSAITLSSGSATLTASNITNITQATNAVVTTTGGVFLVDDEVSISGVTGMTQINGGPYTVIAVSGNNITLNVNSSAFTAYISGGIIFLTNFYGIVPGTINVTVGIQTYTEPVPPNGTLVGSGGGTGTINYATGLITISGGGSSTLTGTFSYYPGLPVMGLQDFQINNPEITNPSTSAQYPILLAFDTEFSYQINQAVTPPEFYNTTFYKNTGVPFTWSGQDFQLFWTTNYSGALWATNNNPGFNILDGTYVSGSPGTTITFNFKYHGTATNFTNLIVNDVLWFNEWTSPGVTLNGITGTVTNNAGAASGNYVVTFSSSVTVSGTGIVQLLTNSVGGQDGIKWYDGDPTGATGIPSGSGKGWVNFMPPLTATTVSINNLPAQKYYLVGALAILPFKDRLLFFSPWVQSTANASAIQLIDTVLWSWNGTPYYTVNNATPPTASLVPNNQTANLKAYYVDQTGLGGYLPAGISQPIKLVANNEDALIIGFGGDGRKTRFVYTGNDLQPFLFFTINSELPSSSPFSSVTLDRGAIDIGQYGIVMTDQQSAQRIDLDIPDTVFQIQNINNGNDRVNAIRDFIREWIYFSFPAGENISPFGSNNSQWKFPTQTLLFNYRDNTWAILYENYTVHGYYRPQMTLTWATLPYNNWGEWRMPWNSGSQEVLQTDIIAGNPQGYVLNLSEDDTDESVSGSIVSLSNSSGSTQITSTNHCVAINDFLYISNLLGSTITTITGITLGNPTIITTVNSYSVGQFVLIENVGGTTQLNGIVFDITAATGAQISINVDSTHFTPYTSGGTTQIVLPAQIGLVTKTIDANNFVIDIPFTSLTYIGLGQYTRLCQPFIQTKQFQPYWQEGRAIRLGPQKYLFDTTDESQLTVNIYLSQDAVDAWNNPNVVGSSNGIIYTQTVFTCPESTNLGLTPANVNLQTPIGAPQNQIWHRMNTSLQGDSVQIGITLSKDQMKNLEFATSEITLHAIQMNVEKGPLVA